MTTYDENITENPFHREVAEKHLDLLEKASSEGWILCVPCRGAVTEPISNTDVYEHILILNGSSNSCHSLNKTCVKLQNDCVLVKDENGTNGSVKILFKETVYWKNLKYRVLCLDCPLNSKELHHRITHVTNLRDCKELLKCETGYPEILQQLDEICDKSFSRQEGFHDLKDLVQGLYGKCLLLILKYNSLQDRVSNDRLLIKNLKISVETYVQHCLDNDVFENVCSITSRLDAYFNKQTRNLQHIQLEHLGVSHYQDSVLVARNQMYKLNRCTTALAKLECLKDVFGVLSRGKEQSLNADDLVQLFTYLIITTNLNNWQGNLKYLKHFTSLHLHAQESFLLTTFEAAVEYINSDNLLHIETESSHNELFDAVRACDIETIEKIFTEGNNEAQGNSLCHPLCTCDKCESLVTNCEKYTPNWQDEKGQTALHVACLVENAEMVRPLISYGADVMKSDYSGQTPSHYAARCGNKSALFFLLVANADCNKADLAGNTPLLLACNNGHKKCVKTLIYMDKSLNIDFQNYAGDSALHCACRWGYISIVKILLEYNANVTIKNNRGQQPIDVTCDSNIRTLIFNSMKKKELESTLNVEDRKNISEQSKKIDLLLKAIEDGDIPLSCFYMSVPVPCLRALPKNHCHPLCRCDNCLSNNDNSESYKCSFAKINTCSVVKHNLNINTCNLNGYTALHVAAKFGRDEIVRLLLDKGADVNSTTFILRQTPLHLACINQRCNVVKDLLKSRACNIDAQDAKGNTAMHYACIKDDTKILEILLINHCDITVRNNAGKTALQEAQDRSLSKVIKLIREKIKLPILIDHSFFQ